jgi:hypothetical protein
MSSFDSGRPRPVRFENGTIDIERAPRPATSPPTIFQPSARLVISYRAKLEVVHGRLGPQRQRQGRVALCRSRSFRTLAWTANSCERIPRSTKSQLGNGIEGDRSRSFTTRGANSPHSTPTPSLTFRDTYAVITSARCDGDGILILTSIIELSRRSTSDFMSAPLKLRFLMQPSARAKASADT